MAATVFLTFLAAQTVSLARPQAHFDASVDYYDPRLAGGSMLNNGAFYVLQRVPQNPLTLSTAGGGLGEPLNVIISGQSSPEVLTNAGIVQYARAIGFSEECLGIHLGDPQAANLGDGHGWVNQTMELREDYGDPDIGTCLESLIGGNHFRVYRQDGPSANSGALFLAVSQEEDVFEQHTIIPDGYNIGRNKLVQHALGAHSFDGVTYETTARNVTGLMPAGAVGVNHGIATDGIVTLLQVTTRTA